ncbi:MAG: ubiquinone/menaquinone biosynthesis methyltransferase [Chloroflexi bacterium]|nr:ubiquinone/menaquinone biosynthesis methyltransferase [Chloroflexota bacterium]
MAAMGVLPSAEDKPRYVARMFGRIAHRYDLMNALMSLGMDRGWRGIVADEASVEGARRVLDVGTGTGQVALTLRERMSVGASVVGVDFAEPMLRAGSPSVAGAVHLGAADALRLPFPAETFDAVVSAYLVRNLVDVHAGLREQVRVLRRGGRLVVLEITPGPGGILRPLFRLYFRGIVPLLGRLVAGESEAYTYLPESAAAFLQPERLADLLRDAGVQDVRVQRVGLGSVAITSGTKG